MDIKVSVIIPTFNRAHLISETIASIISQSFQPSEIIVIDDGSTDDTDRVIGRFKEAVGYHKIENSGVCKARNVGVAKARNEWIAFCDSDDLWHRDKLLHQVELLREMPEIEYCFTNFVTFKDGQWSQNNKFDDAPADYWKIPRLEITPHSFMITEPFYKNLLRFQPIFPSTILMTKSFFYRVGGFNEPFGKKMSEDFEFSLRCVQEKSIGVIEKPLVGIRWHEQNYSRGNIPGVSFVIGDIDVLNYSMKNHRLGAQHESLIKEQIISRSLCVAHGAFVHGENEIFREMLENIPPARRPLRLWLKKAIVNLPLPVARAVQKGITRS